MKYYIINSNGKEVSFDLSFGSDVNRKKEVHILEKRSIKQTYQVRELAGKTYLSKDGKNWKKLTQLSAISNLVNVDETLKIYRGFRPSGLSDANAGDLITDMPGKIVKVLTTVGAIVQAEDTLIILEAMKMENEIKAGVSGLVKAVHVEEGQVLDSGHLMVEIEE